MLLSAVLGWLILCAATLLLHIALQPVEADRLFWVGDAAFMRSFWICDATLTQSRLAPALEERLQVAVRCGGGSTFVAALCRARGTHPCGSALLQLSAPGSPQDVSDYSPDLCVRRAAVCCCSARARAPCAPNPEPPMGESSWCRCGRDRARAFARPRSRSSRSARHAPPRRAAARSLSRLRWCRTFRGRQQLDASPSGYAAVAPLYDGALHALTIIARHPQEGILTRPHPSTRTFNRKLSMNSLPYPPSGCLAALGASIPRTAGTTVDASPPVATVKRQPHHREFLRVSNQGAHRLTSADSTAQQRELALDNLIRARSWAAQRSRKVSTRAAIAPRS